jgi:hypothetical protein
MVVADHKCARNVVKLDSHLVPATAEDDDL